MAARSSICLSLVEQSIEYGTAGYYWRRTAYMGIRKRWADADVFIRGEAADCGRAQITIEGGVVWGMWLAPLLDIVYS